MASFVNFLRKNIKPVYFLYFPFVNTRGFPQTTAAGPARAAAARKCRKNLLTRRALPWYTSVRKQKLPASHRATQVAQVAARKSASV
jgi:hypothetical protein